MRITGSGGRLRLGYQPAASVTSWTLTRTQVEPRQEYELQASLSDVDAFWSQQSPMTLELSVGQRRWVWSPILPAIHAQSLTAVLVGGPSIH